MRIQDIRIEHLDDQSRCVADIHWEVAPRDPQTIYFAVQKRHAHLLRASPEAFLLGGVHPAIEWGESRIAIDGRIDPLLLQTLPVSLEWFRLWSEDDLPPISIEPAGTRSDAVNGQLGAAFLSGGIDSLAMLKLNRDRFPASHPAAIRHAFLVYGFDLGYEPGVDPHMDLFERIAKGVEDAARDVDVEVVRVYTNVRHLESEVSFWIKRFHGAALASVGHALSSNLATVHIAATFDLKSMAPWGSHPLVDPNYGTSSLRIVHQNSELSRLSKTRVVSNWPKGIANVRVCTSYPSGGVNCGRCEKCLRTSLALMALGRYEAASFVAPAPTPEDLEQRLGITNAYQASCYRELAQPLRTAGFAGHAKVVDQKLRRYALYGGPRPRELARRTAQKLDRRFLRGRLRSGIRSVKRFRAR